MAPDCFDILAPVEILSAKVFEAAIEECHAHQEAYDWQNPFCSGVEVIPACCELGAKPWPVVHWWWRKGTRYVLFEKGGTRPGGLGMCVAASGRS